MYDLSPLEEKEITLLSNFAVLPPENIPFEILEEFLLNWDALDEDLFTLTQKGWLDFSKSERSFKISPVIQNITLEKNKERLFEDCQSLIKSLTDLLSVEEQRQEYHLNFKWLPYTYKIRKLFSEKPELSKFNSNLALVLKTLGGEQNLLEAKELLEKALASDIINFGENTLTVAIRQSNLATVLKTLGGEQNLLEAKELLEKALASDIINFGENTLTVAIRQSNLATVLKTLGGEQNLLEAKKLLERALASDIRLVT